jgi:Mor family transcriptional regulator
MRTFGRLRQLLASHADLVKKLQELEMKYDESFRVVFEVIERLTESPDEPQDAPPKELIGFRP